MCLTRRLVLLISIVLTAATAIAQQPPQRDPQAVALLQKSVVAMGGSIPSGSIATGTVTIVAGSKTESGTIRILTRGLDQTAEEIQTADEHRAVIYSRGQADERQGTSIKPLAMELAVTSQSADFPLPFLAAILNDSDIVLQYVGPETLDGSPVHHIRIWSGFSSQPKLRHLSEFSLKDFWLDAASGLPRKLSYIRRAGGGSAARIPVEIYYSDYRNAGGVLYPFLIEKSLNGTPWTTITVQSVQLNAGVSDSDFALK